MQALCDSGCIHADLKDMRSTASAAACPCIINAVGNLVENLPPSQSQGNRSLDPRRMPSRSGRRLSVSIDRSQASVRHFRQQAGLPGCWLAHLAGVLLSARLRLLAALRSCFDELKWAHRAPAVSDIASCGILYLAIVNCCVALKSRRSVIFLV